MLILPYSTELRLSKAPYVVYAVIFLCVVVFYYQNESRKEINAVVDKYCQSIYEPDKKHAKYDYMRSYKESCVYYLTWMNDSVDKEDWILLNKKHFGKKFTIEELKKYAVFENEHYNKIILLGVAKSLDAQLMYYPNSYNPFKMLTSAISHGGWSHIVFNLIFFFAFAPTLEILAGSKLKFIGLLVAIEIIGGIAYSLASISSGNNIPTLGLSGSVMGMIGFSAYLMPWARIRTLLWLLHFAKSVAIPAWFLAMWYIGWDVYDLFSRTENGGVNVLSHVAGGISGYVLGYLFFKRNKEDAKYELGVEIDYMRSKRESLSALATLYKGDKVYVENKLREHEAKKAYGKYNEELYRLVKTGKPSDAIALMIKPYEVYEESPEIYVELFNQIGEWSKKRVYLCAGRLTIDLLIDKKKYGEIPAVLTSCIDTDTDFVLADPLDLIFLVKYLLSVHEFKLGYELIRNAGDKYGDNVNICNCVLLEAKILWEHLNREDDAVILLNNSLHGALEQDLIKLNALKELIVCK